MGAAAANRPEVPDPQPAVGVDGPAPLPLQPLGEVPGRISQHAPERPLERHEPAAGRQTVLFAPHVAVDDEIPGPAGAEGLGLRRHGVAQRERRPEKDVLRRRDEDPAAVDLLIEIEATVGVPDVDPRQLDHRLAPQLAIEGRDGRGGRRAARLIEADEVVVVQERSPPSSRVRERTCHDERDQEQDGSGPPRWFRQLPGRAEGRRDPKQHERQDGQEISAEDDGMGKSLGGEDQQSGDVSADHGGRE